MKEKIKSHTIYYLSSVFILIIGLIVLLTVRQAGFYQTAVIILTFFLYFIWGIAHHALNHDLQSKIVIEYFLIGLLGVSIILFMLRGGIGI